MSHSLLQREALTCCGSATYERHWQREDAEGACYVQSLFRRIWSSLAVAVHPPAPPCIVQQVQDRRVHCLLSRVQDGVAEEEGALEMPRIIGKGTA
jgi:hypothetical protein